MKWKINQPFKGITVDFDVEIAINDNDNSRIVVSVVIFIVLYFILNTVITVLY